MAADTTTSRRAVIAGALGGVAAVVAKAFVPTDEVNAQGQAMIVGGTYFDATSSTGIENVTNNETVLYGQSSHAGTGVLGQSGSGIGVQGQSDTGDGTWGISYGAGRGVIGLSYSTALPANLGWSRGNSTGLHGFSGGSGDSPQAGRAKTGVHGVANQDSTSRGVVGESNAGHGVDGTTSSGVGGYFEASSGVALQASGKVKFNRSGKASIAKGKTYVDVTVPGGLSGSPLPFATPLALHSGVAVSAIRTNYPSAGIMRISINKVASTTVSTPVAWFVLG